MIPYKNKIFKAEAMPVGRPGLPSRACQFFNILWTFTFVVASNVLGVVPSVGGTFIALSSTDSYFIVAADTRIHAGDRTIDRACKTIPLSDGLLFFAAGLYGSGNEHWAAPFDIAREAYRAEPKPSIYDIVSKWAEITMASFRDLSVSNPQEFIPRSPGNEISSGGFAGLSLTGEIEAYIAHIYVRPITDQLSFVANIESIPLDAHLKTTAGFEELVAEFQANRTPRAKKARNDEIGLTGIAQAAQCLRELVNFVIQWGGDPAIGGEVSVLSLERNIGIRWFRPRPDFCPEN
jgi:hypothetical protein